MSTYLKPPAILRVANPVLTFIGFPTLTIRGRKTGKRRTVPLNVLEREGRRYLMAPRGQTRWALNLRANPDCEIRRRGQKRSYRAVEITDLEEKKALIDAYLQRVA